MELAEVELRSSDLHWLPEGDPHDDCCVHGGIYLRLGDQIVSDGTSEWTVSTAAFRLLGTISNDHDRNIDDSLIPCCGFNMWPMKQAVDGLYIPNCPNGIDWIIQHSEPRIVAHILSDGRTILTNAQVWSKAVCEFADPIYEFFLTAWPKNFYDEESQLGFELFISLWKERRAAACLMSKVGE